MTLDDYLSSEIVIDCADGVFSRREAFRRLMLLGLSASAAAAMLAACGSDDDAAESPASPAPTPTLPDAAGVATTDVTTNGATAEPPTTSTEPQTTAAAQTTVAESVDGEILFPGPRGELIGVLATAANAQGAVLVIHENRGLTDHIRSIPPRLAADGYTALAIDLLSEEGGTASLAGDGEATGALGNASTERLIEDLRAGLDELERRAPGAKLAVIGFCFGGAMTWQLLAAGEARLSAAVPFYGPAPSGADFGGSPNAAVLGVFAELDARVNASLETARSSLEAAGLTHEISVFPGVDHAFFNDTGGRYNAEQAAAAYQAMLAWFGEHLAG